MKKCLHLKKTKAHWRSKPPKVITWRERLEIERKWRNSLYAFRNAAVLPFINI